MAERTNARLLKSLGSASSPWVQIPLPPLVRGTFLALGRSRQERQNAGTGNAAPAFEDALGRVGSFAAGHGTGLLVTVDKAQMAPQEDLSAVARALQTVVARRLQPVAVVGPYLDPGSGVAGDHFSDQGCDGSSAKG